MGIKQIINTDCFEFLKFCSHFHFAFADPPDNISLNYKGFEDKFTEKEYENFLYNLINKATSKCNVLWLSLNSRYADLIGHIIYQWKNDDWKIKHCVQTYTFSQYNRFDLSDGHRIMYRLMRKNTKLYPNQIKIPSWRQLNGDKRANSGGKIPSNVFDFPRVTGNSKQRRHFSPTQLHEGLYERCIKLCCVPGDTVVDLFAGSGTLGRVADTCEVNVIMLEYSRETCDNILADQPEVEEVLCNL